MADYITCILEYHLYISYYSIFTVYIESESESEDGGDVLSSRL
jgi:hypothetical protein